MVKSCSAYKCNNVWSPNQDIQYHRFPLKNPPLLEQWIKAARLENFTPTPHTLICSQHFNKEDYSESTAFKKRLKSNVVPSVFSFLESRQNKSNQIKLGRAQDLDVETKIMGLVEDSSGLITMDHAYAAQKNVVVKIENDDSEMFTPNETIDSSYIKSEDISIKSEINDEDTDLNSSLCQYEFDTVDIKKEKSLDITEQSEGDKISHALIKDEFEITKQKITILTEENNLLKAENELLKSELHQYSELKAETVELKETIKSYQAELSAFDDLKRYHQQIENQIIRLKTKMTDFSENIIPSMKKNHFKEVQQLKNEVESKNKSLLSLNKEINRLVKCINNINKKLTSVNETNRNNYLKQSHRADEYEAKWRKAVENQKDVESALKLRENELSKTKQELSNLVRTYTALIDTYGNCLKHNEELRLDFGELKKKFNDKVEANRNLREELNQAHNKISELYPCKYCGL
ncbi:THAP domain-containing protein 5-like [Diorhabda sublineata]|uniref:THAP domain-containing protein 5-like n=1 Tax=Diorhabda sublineata TaxID=1163346 RepID=UPI0024E04F8F|nr:THAP domain-containing protein 5-like [Diorhabda sublineata]